MGSTQKALLLQPEVHIWLSQGNALGLAELWLNQITFFIEQFYLTEWPTDELRLFRSRYLENTFLKMNKPVT